MKGMVTTMKKVIVIVLAIIITLSVTSCFLQRFEKPIELHETEDTSPPIESPQAPESVSPDNSPHPPESTPSAEPPQVAVPMPSVSFEATSTSNQTEPQRWEYIHCSFNDLQELNRLGAEGWEVVTSGGYNTFNLLLKRPLP